MNKKHRNTLAAVRATPTLATIRWADMEKLAVALGAEVTEGRGSRVRLMLNGIPGDFHRPHPGKEAKKYVVRAFAHFLALAGVE